MITLLVLLLISLASVAALYFLRRRRARQTAAQKNAGILPFHANSEKPLASTYKPSSSRRSRHRRLGNITISSHLPSRNNRRKSEPQQSFVDAEKREFLASTSSEPTSPLPQIHITFPEEVDATTGQPTQGSGKVVRVFVDDKGSVGMAPVSKAEIEGLSTEKDEHFVSLDLDRMGGLKETELNTKS